MSSVEENDEVERYFKNEEYHNFLFRNATCSLASEHKTVDENTSLEYLILDLLWPQEEIIQFYTHFPGAVRNVSEEGKSVLHQVCGLSIVSTDCSATTRNIHTNKSGTCELSDDQDVQFVQEVCIKDETWLLVENPRGFFEKDNFGFLSQDGPVEGVSLGRLILAVLEVFPEAASMKDGEGQYPLHIAVENRSATAEAVLALIAVFPEAAAQQDSSGYYPLHCAAGNEQITGEAIKALIQAFPGAAAEKDGGARFPLHFAAVTEGITVEVIEALIEAYPQAAGMKDDQGKHPLHRAAGVTKVTVEVISSLIEVFPEAAGQKDSHGQCPLHYAAANKGMAGAVVKALYNAFPGAAAEKDASGRYPLTIAIYNEEKSDETLKELLEAFPQAAAEIEEGGCRYPLHIAAGRDKVAADVIKAFIAAFSQAVSLKDHDEKYPLHLVVASERATAEAVLALIAVFPEAAAQQDSSGYYPLHCAAGNKQITGEAIKALIQAFPGAAAEKDKEGRLPLSIAARAAVHAVKPLVQAYPQAASEKTSEGHYPLRIAVKNKEVTAEAILALIDAFPEAAAQADRNGYYPLHLAATNKAMTAEAIKALFEAFPRAAAEKEESGQRPLGMAVLSGGMTVEVIKALLEAHPQAAAERDDRQRYPLHCAVDNSEVTVDIIRALIEAFPQAAARSDSGSEYPLNMAAGNYRVTVEGIKALIEAHPQAGISKPLYSQYPFCVAARVQGMDIAVVKALIEAFPQAELKERHFDASSIIHDVSSNRLITPETLKALVTFHFPEDVNMAPQAPQTSLWAEFLDPSIEFKPSVRLAVVDQVLQERRKFARALAHLHDAKGRDVYGIVDKGVKTIMNRYILLCGAYELDDGPAVHRSATSVVMFGNDQRVEAEYEKIFDLYQIDDALNFDAFVAIHNSEFKDLIQFNVSGVVDVLQAKQRSYEDLLHQAHLSAFHRIDSSGEGLLARCDWLSYCKAKLGTSRRVVIKFMLNEDQFKREVEVRKGCLDPKFVVGILAHFEGEKFAEEVNALEFFDGKKSWHLRGYKHAIVMPAADRNLDTIFRSERPDIQHVKLIAREIVEALQHCHEQGVMHGDVKMLNIVRVGHRMRLIDLDASADLGVEHAGAKFSSGTLHPEMFHALRGNEEAIYTSYWGIANATAGTPEYELWVKIKPTVANIGRKSTKIVVKTFRVETVRDEESDGEENARFVQKPITPERLPYSLVKGSTHLDVWSFGLLLFQLCSGQSFLPLNRDDDLSEPASVYAAAMQTDEVIGKKISDMKMEGEEAPLVRDLLRKILTRDTNKRYEDMNAVLEHPWFKGGSADGSGSPDQLTEAMSTIKRMEKLLVEINNRTIAIEDLSTQIKSQIETTGDMLLRGMVEAADVTVPTCFVIVNEPLVALGCAEETEPGTAGEAEAMDSDQESKAKHVTGWIRRLSDIGTYVSKIAEKVEVASERIIEAYDKINEIASKLQDPFANFPQDTYYLYLVDEYTMRPIVPVEGSSSPYPILITQPKEVVSKYMPLMKVSLKAMAVYNGAAGLVQCFGYPVPKIPASLTQYAAEAVGKLDKESSVAEFDILQSRLSDRKASTKPEDAKALRGKQLSDFASFLSQADNDPDRDYCQLRRVVNREGRCLWTLEENVNLMQSGVARLTSEERSTDRSDQSKDSSASSAEAAALKRTFDQREAEMSAEIARLTALAGLKAADSVAPGVAGTDVRTSPISTKAEAELRMKLQENDKKMAEKDVLIQQLMANLERVGHSDGGSHCCAFAPTSTTARILPTER